MTTRKIRPPGCPPEYDAREMGLWCQIQGLHKLTGRLHDRIVVLETLTARMLKQLRDVQSTVEFAEPTPPTNQPGALVVAAELGSGDPAPSSVAGADPAPRRRRKGGAG